MLGVHETGILPVGLGLCRVIGGVDLVLGTEFATGCLRLRDGRGATLTRISHVLRMEGALW